MPLARMPVKTHGIKINLMVSADCELTSIFRNIGQRISQNGYVARFRDFLARGVKARELRRQAIVKGEHGLPVRARSYGNRFRDIARAAGIPDAVFGIWTPAPAVPPRPAHQEAFGNRRSAQ